MDGSAASLKLLAFPREHAQHCQGNFSDSNSLVRYPMLQKIQFSGVIEVSAVFTEIRRELFKCAL